MGKIKIIEHKGELDSKGEPIGVEIEVDESAISLDILRVNKLLDYAEAQGWI